MLVLMSGREGRRPLERCVIIFNGVFFLPFNNKCQNSTLSNLFRSITLVAKLHLQITLSVSSSFRLSDVTFFSLIVYHSSEHLLNIMHLLFILHYGDFHQYYCSPREILY